MSKLLLDTPIEKHLGIFVKREDLCVPPGAPPFSKIRGLIKHLQKLQEQGFIGVSYVETSISMAGWGVAWACSKLGMKCLIFNPVYKEPLPLLQYHRQQWDKWGAELIDVPAGRAKVNFYRARNQTPKGYKLLPLGLPLDETILQTKKIAQACISSYSTIVLCVGSGTIASGIYQATSSGQTLYGVMSRSGQEDKKKSRITRDIIFSDQHNAKLVLVNEGWEYAEPSTITAPFPCHPYYDAKAWEWLMKNKENLQAPILFWNIGSTGEFECQK